MKKYVMGETCSTYGEMKNSHKILVDREEIRYEGVNVVELK
jgi:hypothetical protein